VTGIPFSFHPSRRRSHDRHPQQARADCHRRSPRMTSFCSVRVIQAKNALCTTRDALGAQFKRSRRVTGFGMVDDRVRGEGITPGVAEWLTARVDLVECRPAPALHKPGICGTAGWRWRGWRRGRWHPRRAVESHGRGLRATHSPVPLTETIPLKPPGLAAPQMPLLFIIS
jgi:hypothetical protein